MSLSSLPPEILSVIAEKLEKDDWKRLILVSKDLRNATRRLLWKSLYIESLERFEFLMNLFEQEIYLGRGVKNLIMDFSRDLYFTTFRSGPLKKTFSSITKERFLSFIKLLPMIEQLTFEDASFPLFTPLEVAEPLLPLLHTLNYYSRVDAVTNTLSSLLQMAPNLTTLKFLTEVNEQTAQLSISSPLKSLSCSFQTFFPWTDKSFIPHSSIRNLQRLTLLALRELDDTHISNLVDTIRFYSSTLLEINYLTQILNFELFRPTLAGLKVLEILDLIFHELPIDIFQLLPITLRKVSSKISAKHLKHLHLYPRPLLALQELRFDTLDAETIQYLPESVVKINLIESEGVHGGPNNVDLRKVFGWVESRKRKNLREICVLRPSDGSNDDDVVRNFKEMGIHLEIEEWLV